MALKNGSPLIFYLMDIEKNSIYKKIRFGIRTQTHLLIMATPYQHKHHQYFGISRNTGNETIVLSYTEKLFGGFITNDFKFNKHLKDNEKSAFRSLTSRVNALANIINISSFKTRKSVANGIVLLKLVYLIQWWGGCSDYLINFLQVLQNRAARLFTRHGIFITNAVVLHQCGWLSVRRTCEKMSANLIFKRENGHIILHRK